MFNKSEIQLCEDCTTVVVNGDYSIFDYQMNGRGPEAEAKRDARVAEVDAGLVRIGFVSPTGSHNDLSIYPCGCCGTKLHGSRHGFVAL